MTDYDPKLDKPTYNDAAFVPKAPNRSLYLVVGVIVAIVAAAGLMFFASNTQERNDMARTPDPANVAAPTGETRTPTVPRIAPIPATPAPDTAPATPQ